MPARPGHIQHGCGHQIEPSLRGLQADHRPAQERRAQAGRAIPVIDGAECGGGRMRSPMRGAQARDAPALLIHHQHRLGRQCLPQISDQ
jgi:hypothetical protein